MKLEELVEEGVEDVGSPGSRAPEVEVDELVEEVLVDGIWIGDDWLVVAVVPASGGWLTEASAKIWAKIP